MSVEDQFRPRELLIDWKRLTASVVQLFQECVRTRRHSRWGRVVWRDTNGRLSTAHTSDGFVRRQCQQTDPRSVLSGIQLLRAVFGTSGLMDELVIHQPELCSWELVVSDRMSLTTNSQVDPEPTLNERHAYLTKDRDGPERDYNGDLVRAAIQFDTMLMLPGRDAGLHINSRVQTPVVEGVSYSVQGSEIKIQHVRAELGTELVSELPEMPTDKPTDVARTCQANERSMERSRAERKAEWTDRPRDEPPSITKVSQDTRKSIGKRIAVDLSWQSGDSPLPCLSVGDKATTIKADQYVKLREGNDPINTTACPSGTRIKVMTFNPQGSGGLLADKNMSDFDNLIDKEKPDILVMPEAQIPSGKSRRLGHTARYQTMMQKYASRKRYVVFTAHHNSGRASHGVLIMVKEDIQITQVQRGLDEGHNEQWEGRVLALYTTGCASLIPLEQNDSGILRGIN